MKMTVLLVSLIALATPLAAQETSVTIYGSGSAFVRRGFAVPVAAGTSNHRLDIGLQALDPGALVALDDGVVLGGARVRQAAGRDATFRRAVGREIDFMSFRGDSMRFIRGTVLSIEPAAVRIGSRVMFTLPGEPAFPESLLQLVPTLELRVEAARALPALRLGYFADGLAWRASFAAVVPRVGGGPATVSGTATMDNAMLTLRQAVVQLASGSIRRDYRGGLMMQRGVVGRPRALEELQVSAITVTAAEEAVGEIRTYLLPGRHDFEPGVTSSAPLFAPATATVEREFLLEPRRGVHEQWVGIPADSNLHPEVSYRFRRPDGSAFGEIALPSGVFRVFAPDTAARLQLVGEFSIGETPRGRDLVVSTGQAVDIIADKAQTAFERRGDRDAVVSYRVRVRNGKDESATIRVREAFPSGRWEVLDSTVPVERASAFIGEFRLPVPARSEAVLEYRVRVRW